MLKKKRKNSHKKGTTYNKTPAGTTDRVPLSASTFFLKSGKLPPVVDGDQQFPDEQGR